MSTTNTTITYGEAVAASDFKDKAYRFVSFTDPKSLEVTPAGESPFGISEDNPSVGQPLRAAIFGVPKIVAGEAYAAQEYLMVGAEGKAMIHVPPAQLAGQALSPSSGDGCITTILFAQHDSGNPGA